MSNYLRIKILYLAFLSLFLTNMQGLLAQSSAINITKPELQFRNDTLIIHYNFEHCIDNQRFKVWINAKTPDGKEFHARNLAGDIGDGILCDTGKVIYWDMAADSVSLQI